MALLTFFVLHCSRASVLTKLASPGASKASKTSSREFEIARIVVVVWVSKGNSVGAHPFFVSGASVDKVQCSKISGSKVALGLALMRLSR